MISLNKEQELFINKKLYGLSKSKFRSSFHLNSKMIDYVLDKGIDKIYFDTSNIIKERLASSYPKNDGKQTPMRQVHPTFIAQHATATCCRNCLYKWHHIPKGRELNEKELAFINALIIKWIESEIKKT